MFGRRLARLLRRRRSAAVVLVLCMLVLYQLHLSIHGEPSSATLPGQPTTASDVLADATQPTPTPSLPALETLDLLEVKGRAAKTGYSRSQFGQGWGSVDACDVRNLILKRDLQSVSLSSDGCKVMSGILQDPYTAKSITFTRGEQTSDDVQIDHVVALSDAWQKGAQQLDGVAREELANDPLNLLAVDGDTNQKKGDSDAASWLPPNKDYRCRYVARQISVKKKYSLWVTDAEKSAMKRVLNACPGQVLPVESMHAYEVENDSGGP